MRDVEIPLPSAAPLDRIAQVFDETIEQSGLLVTLRGTLKKFPGSTHWHLKRGRESGTLEVTLWPEQRRAWFTEQHGRVAPWIDAEIVRLGDEMRRVLFPLSHGKN